MYTVYILQNDGGKYYIGYTGNLIERLERHQQGRSRFTSQFNKWKLVYQEDFSSKFEALRRERFIKNQKSRRYIEILISQYSGVEKQNLAPTH